MIELGHDLIRTLAIIRQLALGKRLVLPDGTTVAMGDDYTVGFVINVRGVDQVSQLSDLTVRELNKLCNEFEIGPIIPEMEGG